MLGISGKYRLDARLGGGGMAEVFIGSMVGAEGFSRRVAIKRVLPGFSDNPAFSQMFIAEAQISARLVHPNIVSVVDFDRDAENRLFLVMELVEGKDLDALMATGLLPFPVVIFAISEVLRGLGHAHDLPVHVESLDTTVTRGMRGIVHRDVSPHNVLLSWDGAVKVSDFGIAKARSASEATASVFIKGKPAYMSPEQANGQPLDGRSDLFAVGVMLWEMLAGRRLFVGEDTRATLAAVLFGQIPRPRTVRPEVPKDLERVAMKLLERDLQARYATAEQAIHDLFECADAPKGGRETLIRALAERFPQQAPVRQSVLRSRGGTPVAPHDAGTIPAGAAGRPRPAAAVPSLGAVMSAPTRNLGARRGPNKALLVGAVVASAAATFGIVTAVTRSRKPTPDAAPPAVAMVARPDAAPPPDAPPPAPPDASVADAAAPPLKKEASSTPPAHPAADKRFGRLIVRAFPVLTVYVDNKKIHDTPVDMPLPVGKHTLRLTNSEVGRNETVPVTIDEHQTTTIERE